MGSLHEPLCSGVGSSSGKHNSEEMSEDEIYDVESCSRDDPLVAVDIDVELVIENIPVYVRDIWRQCFGNVWVMIFKFLWHGESLEGDTEPVLLNAMTVAVRECKDILSSVAMRAVAVPCEET